MFSILLFVGVAAMAPPTSVQRTIPAEEFRPGPGVARDPETGGWRLARSRLLAHETAATDFRLTDKLGDAVQAKKQFTLSASECKEGELFWYGSAKGITLNGQAIGPIKPLVSTGWQRLRVPVASLRAGVNEFVFTEASLLIEPGRPGQSFRSVDGGKTWSDRALGHSADLTGEYVVRLRLEMPEARGELDAPVFDLWPTAEDGLVHPARVLSLPQSEVPVLSVRTGPTPVPDRNWSDWLSPESAAIADHRWAQVRHALTNTGSPTPANTNYRWQVELQTVNGDTWKMSLDQPPAPPGSRLDFTYAAPSTRLKQLRQQFRLDDVIAPGTTEMEQLMLLRHWVRNQWHTAWEGGADAWMPPWDALVILANKDRPDCLTMCTHYAAVFTQCAQALGWNARHCILDHHCVSEVFVNSHDRWVMFDPGNTKARGDLTLHFERDGVPLSARELHVAFQKRSTEGISVRFVPERLMIAIEPLCRPGPKVEKPRPEAIPLERLSDWPVCQFDQYRRYALPPRNTFLTSPFPGELCQGRSLYAYDGYRWVGDSPDRPTRSPEYTHHLDPARPRLTDEPINRVRLHLARTAQARAIQVDLETHTPNLLRLERWPKDRWSPTPARWVWKPMTEGELRVRSVNAWERAGKETVASGVTP
jgi:hypothetical protein